MKSDTFKGLKEGEFASFSNFFSTVKPTTYNGTVTVDKKKSALHLDPRKIAAAQVNRDYVNQLMGF